MTDYIIINRNLEISIFNVDGYWQKYHNSVDSISYIGTLVITVEMHNSNWSAKDTIHTWDLSVPFKTGFYGMWSSKRIPLLTKQMT